MRWPWNRREHGVSDEARFAACDAARALVDARNLSRRVDRLADQLAETRKRNHFAAAIADAMRGMT